jgi:hypothetical protein
MYTYVQKAAKHQDLGTGDYEKGVFITVLHLFMTVKYAYIFIDRQINYSFFHLNYRIEKANLG